MPLSGAWRCSASTVEGVSQRRTGVSDSGIALFEYAKPLKSQGFGLGVSEVFTPLHTGSGALTHQVERWIRGIPRG